MSPIQETEAKKRVWRSFLGSVGTQHGPPFHTASASLRDTVGRERSNEWRGRKGCLFGAQPRGTAIVVRPAAHGAAAGERRRFHHPDFRAVVRLRRVLGDRKSTRLNS